jgi:hypothetical protein
MHPGIEPLPKDTRSHGWKTDETRRSGGTSLRLKKFRDAYNSRDLPSLTPLEIDEHLATADDVPVSDGCGRSSAGVIIRRQSCLQYCGIPDFLCAPIENLPERGAQFSSLIPSYLVRRIVPNKEDTMSRAAKSILAYGVYLILLGLALLIAPNVPLPLFGLPPRLEA